MEALKIEMPWHEADSRYRAYLRDRQYDEPMDREIRRIYHALSKGKTVIRALASIVAAGVNAQGMPKLAIARADELTIECQRWSNGSFEFRPPGGSKSRDRTFTFRAGSLPPAKFSADSGWWPPFEGVVPIIPLPLRPRRALAGYHILFEAEWKRAVPIDPYLLKRLGKGDTWLVCGAWDLTPVEAAVLASRLH